MPSSRAGRTFHLVDPSPQKVKPIAPFFFAAACSVLVGCAQTHLNSTPATTKNYSKEVTPVSRHAARTKLTTQPQPTPPLKSQEEVQIDAELEQRLRDMDRLIRERVSTTQDRRLSEKETGNGEIEKKAREKISDARAVEEQKQVLREMQDLTREHASRSDTRTAEKRNQIIKEMQKDLTREQDLMSNAETEVERKQALRQMEKVTHNTASMLRPLSDLLPRVATRAYLYAGQPTPTGYGAYAYLIFNADPEKIDHERCMAVCEAFNGYLALTTESRSVPERRSQMVTFWPLTGSFTGEPDCHRLVANYDRNFAAQIAASVSKQGARGPLLVAWTQPYGERDSKALVLDMSNFANVDLGRAIQKWEDQIALEPTHWQQGWKAVVVREEIRNAIENSAPVIVNVIATFFQKSAPKK
jgi:hypothetical protein